MIVGRQGVAFRMDSDHAAAAQPENVASCKESYFTFAISSVFRSLP
jgi:hypothetical protein